MAARDSNDASPTLLRDVRACMQKVLNLNHEESAAIGTDATPLSVPGWTSLTHVLLILELERTFDVVFEPDQIAAMASVGAIVGALERMRA